jgi:hypothetical protein
MAQAPSPPPPPPPAPTIDRIGFPAGYQTDYKLLYVFDRPDNNQIRIVYGNDLAASVKADQAYFFPYGSVLVMETWRAKRDSQGNIELDENGRFQKDTLGGIFVMRKDPGFGEDYKQNRNGEWEYVAYKLDGTHLTPPQNTGGCAVCHLQAGQSKDWVFRASLYFANPSGAVPTSIIQHYTFVPGTIRMKAGSTLSIYNYDEVAHTFTANNMSFDSKEITPGGSFAVTFKDHGEIEYHCSIHPAMKGKIVVEPTGD